MELRLWSVKALAGRKSDGRDAQRIAEYLQDGRLDGSFVPPAEIRELRMLLRHRVALLEQRNEVHNQIRDLGPERRGTPTLSPDKPNLRPCLWSRRRV